MIIDKETDKRWSLSVVEKQRHGSAPCMAFGHVRKRPVFGRTILVDLIFQFNFK